MLGDALCDCEGLPSWVMSPGDYADINRLLELSVEAATKSGDRLLRMEIEGLCEKVLRIVDAIA